MKAALIVLALLVPHLAEAHSSCHEVSKVVGYRHCHRFGMWGFPISLGLDLGITTITADRAMVEGALSSMPASARTATGTPMAGELDGRGLEFGWHIGLPHGLYFADDVVLALGIPDPADQANGTFLRSTLAFGMQRSFGRLMVGGDLAAGMRMLALDSSQGAVKVDLDGVVDARARVSMWLTPYVTVGVQGRVDVIDPNDRAIAVVFGLHSAAFDATR